MGDQGTHSRRTHSANCTHRLIFIVTAPLITKIQVCISSLKLEALILCQHVRGLLKAQLCSFTSEKHLGPSFDSTILYKLRKTSGISVSLPTVAGTQDSLLENVPFINLFHPQISLGRETPFPEGCGQVMS